MKSFRGGNHQSDGPSGASSHEAVPGRSTLAEQLPAAAPAAPAQRALDGSGPPLGASQGEVALPRLDLGRPAGKAVGSTEAGVDIGGPKEGDPEGGDGGPKGEGVQAPAEKKKKKAGVESFTVDWAKGASAGPTAAKLRLDYNAKFKKDDDHDPALAEFRQNAMTVWEITDGPHKGAKGNTSPLHDDNYSRADDLAGNKLTDQKFYSNDNPGWSTGQIDKDDVLDYAFTAEQMIIDTSDGNKVIEKRGPHTATIKGKDARAYGNVPKKLG